MNDDGELSALERLARVLPRPSADEVWIGDDAAVLEPVAGQMLFATDLVAEGVHFERTTSSLADVGWKVLTANVSDIAAMGGRAGRCVAAVAGAWGSDLDELYEGLNEAASTYRCPLVGGDLSAAAKGGGLVVTVAIVGTTEGRPPVCRDGASAGERVYVTGPLGAAAAGLALLQGRRQVAPPELAARLVQVHRRPLARAAAGCCAATVGASAMLDVSDGLGIDLDRLCRASGVGVALSSVPCANGASSADAMSGGEDYELVFSVAPEVDVTGAFEDVGLEVPIEIGVLVDDPTLRTLEGRPFVPSGWVHRRDGGC